MRLLTLATGCLLLCTAGCGDETSETDLPEANDAIARSAVASQGVDLFSRAIDSAVSDGTAPEAIGRSRHQPAPLRGLLAAGVAIDSGAVTPMDIDFSAISDFDLLIDFDSDPAYPNASGQVQVTGTVATNASGDLEQHAGSVDFTAVVVEALTPITVTDDAGITVTWPAGTTIAATGSLSWERTDQNNWSFTIAKQIGSAERQVTVVDGERSSTGLVRTDWSGSFTAAAVAGNLQASVSLTGSRAVTWTDGTNDLDVRWEVESLTSIYLTLAGVRYGPFTAGQLHRRYGVKPVLF